MTWVAFLNLLVILCCSVVIFSRRVVTGVFMTFGLGLFCLAAIADMDPTVNEEHLTVILYIGVLSVCVSLLLRSVGVRCIVRRDTEPGVLDEQPHHHVQ